MEPWNAVYKEVQCGSTDLTFVLPTVIIAESTSECCRNDRAEQYTNSNSVIKTNIFRIGRKVIFYFKIKFVPSSKLSPTRL
jgi:hypothetical protein